MPSIPVHVKHAGKVHDLQINTDLPALAFKESIYQVTGVPVERMKVMVKGGILKDDADWRKIAPKEGQTLMVIGAAGELPKPPPKPIVFLEDMDDATLAQALATPVGLNNLGNTCYMNATIQTLRAIPELQTALDSYQPGSSTSGGDGLQGSNVLTRSMKNMYNEMKKTTDAYTPMAFLAVLRQVVPQFGEVSNVAGMRGYAQQDAEECWSQIANALHALPGLEDPTNMTDSASVATRKKFIEQYMAGEMRRELKCDEAPEEPPTVTIDKVLKLECNIAITTNFLHTGIIDALNQKIEKRSPSLGREAVYTQKSRLSRIPANLTVHMVRFAWKREIGKKAKIMRRVKFPLELDVLDLVTDELKQKLLRANTKLKEFERDRAERRKVRKRTKEPRKDISGTVDVDMADATSSGQPGAGSVTIEQLSPTVSGKEVESSLARQAGDTFGESSQVAPAHQLLPDDVSSANNTTTATEQLKGAALDDESVYREKERKELEALIPEDLKQDVGCSVTGLYDLVGIVTHKGAAADSGHYIGFVKKSAFHSVSLSVPPDGKLPPGTLDPDDDNWYKFDDDKVSEFPTEKLATLEGGGEDAVAYVLLYRSKPLA